MHNFRKNIVVFFIIILMLSSVKLFANELIIGEEKIEPGIVLIFEGAVKDSVHPLHLHLEENNTQVHIEARVNWGEQDIPESAVPGGFIPYLHITSKVVNERTGLTTFIDLLPHLNLIDNFHYARNIALPGDNSDRYTVIFNVLPPQSLEVSFHHDWKMRYDSKLLDEVNFTYTNVDFEEIANATRAK